MTLILHNSASNRHPGVFIITNFAEFQEMALSSTIFWFGHKRYRKKHANLHSKDYSFQSSVTSYPQTIQLFI